MGCPHNQTARNPVFHGANTNHRLQQQRHAMELAQVRPQRSPWGAPPPYPQQVDGGGV